MLNNSDNPAPATWGERLLDLAIVIGAAVLAGIIGFGFAGGNLPWQ